jgi:transcriptional regulator with XRE-family HTH domain
MTPVEIRLREVRKSAGLTQAQLAKKAGMAQGEISRIESSATMISLDVVDRLCRALKCEPGDILVRTRR